VRGAKTPWLAFGANIAPWCETDERRRRQLAAVEARDAGCGGVSLVAQAAALVTDVLCSLQK
jgi:hypothetical protein